MGETRPTASGGGPLDRLKGKVKEVAGSILGNQDLREEGQLHQARANAEQEAQREAAQADQRQTEAQLAIKEKELAAERQQLMAEQAAESDRQRVEHDRRQAERQIERDFTQREAALDNEKQSQQWATIQAEAAALRERHDAEADAGRIDQAAEQARHAAARLDTAQQHQSEK
jgi:uncharacterized protein YjbJ (UPF0337 family)